MKNVLSAHKIILVDVLFARNIVVALLAVFNNKLREKRQTVKLSYVWNIVFYGVKNVKKYADRLSPYGRNQSSCC